MKKFAVIMAGGLGVKLWPRSTEKSPKQFIHMIGDGTMIQNTFKRLSKYFDVEDIFVVTYKDLKEKVVEQLEDLPKDNLIIEPFGRNTAPCLGLATTILKNRYREDSVMMVFPSDHVIFNNGNLYQCLDLAYEAAYEKKGIVTIGIEPKIPETQYGYVQINEDHKGLGDLYDRGVRHSNTFAEKPDVGTALRFIESGDFLWNTGIFSWRMDTFKKAFRSFLPDHNEYFSELGNHIGKDTYENRLEHIYKKMDSISVDYGILEKAENVLIVKSDLKWSDLGTWDELYNVSLKDAKNNVIVGDVVALNTKNSLIRSNGKMISVIGMEDVIVIDSEHSLFICKRGQSEDVKEMIDYMRRKYMKTFL